MVTPSVGSASDREHRAHLSRVFSPSNPNQVVNPE